MKFISKENFEYIWNHLTGLLSKKLDSPETGTAGQFLAKTANGTEWKTVEIPEAGDSLPTGGTKGQVLTKTETGEEWADITHPTELPTGGTTGDVLTKTAEGTEWKAGQTVEALSTDEISEILKIFE